MNREEQINEELFPQAHKNQSIRHILTILIRKANKIPKSSVNRAHFLKSPSQFRKRVLVDLMSLLFINTYIYHLVQVFSITEWFSVCVLCLFSVIQSYFRNSQNSLLHSTKATYYYSLYELPSNFYLQKKISLAKKKSLS